MRVLDRAKLPYAVQPYTYDTEQLEVSHIATENNLPLEQIYKTLVLKGDKNGILVALVNGSEQLQLKKVAQASGNKKVALLSTKDLLSATGYIRGGCSPIGMKKDYPIYLDEQALSLPRLYLNAGSRGLLLALSPEDLRQAIDVIVVPLVWL